jgi:class 3 adenylate cyclase
MPKSAPFVPRTLPPLPPEKPKSRAQREREAKAYWDSLTEAQEVWALGKMGIERFLRDVWDTDVAVQEPDRLLATVMFTDIVGSTAKASEVGDARWRELLERHHQLIRRQLARARGKEVDTAGDGFLAAFDGPARAIRCACAIVESVQQLGLNVRIGLHTGECELIDGKVAGIAVHTGARVAASANPGEVLVTSTVKDLVAGSGLPFQDRGAHELSGIPGQWRLYTVVNPQRPQENSASSTAGTSV